MHTHVCCEMFVRCLVLVMFKCAALQQVPTKTSQLYNSLPMHVMQNKQMYCTPCSFKLLGRTCSTSSWSASLIWLSPPWP